MDCDDKISYRCGVGGDVFRAWMRWKSDAPMEKHHVASFAAGYNAAMQKINKSEADDAK